jgi:hypothetical protein
MTEPPNSMDAGGKLLCYNSAAHHAIELEHAVIVPWVEGHGKDLSKTGRGANLRCLFPRPRIATHQCPSGWYHHPDKACACFSVMVLSGHLMSEPGFP